MKRPVIDRPDLGLHIVPRSLEELGVRVPSLWDLAAAGRLPLPPHEAPIAQTQLCARCRVEEAAPSRKSCPGCLEYDRVKAALRRLEAKEIHGCLVCKAPVKPGTHMWHGKEMRWQHCEEHLEYYRFHGRRG